MAYVITRKTKSGSTSTTLVEAYRDANGRPRQRLLANLHGEPNVLTALAKLAARREALRKEKNMLAAEAVDANKFYEIVTQRTLHGHKYSGSERKEIDALMLRRKRLLQRLAKIEADLTVIGREGRVIKKHCSATPAEVQTAIQNYKKVLGDAEAATLGGEYLFKMQKAKLRRLLR